MSWTGEVRTSAPSRARRFGRQTNFDKLGRMPWGLVALIVGLAMFGTAMLYSSTATNPASADLPVKHFTRFVFSFVLMISAPVAAGQNAGSSSGRCGCSHPNL